MFEALKATKEEKNEETLPSDDDDDDDVNGSDEEETTMFERVFGDACKKVPKSNDVRRAPLEALREALDVVDTLEEKKRKRRNEDGEKRANNGTGGGGGGKSCTSGEYDSDDDSDDDETEYSTEDFQSSEASSLLSFGERARGTQKEQRDNGEHEHKTSSNE